MRDQRGSLNERALSVLSGFHFVTDLEFSQPFSIDATIAAVDSSSSGGPIERRVVLVNH